MKNVKESTKGVTFDQARLKYVSKGLDLIKDLVTSVHESSLSDAQSDMLNKAIVLIDEIQDTIEL